MRHELKREYREWSRALLRGLPGRFGENARRKFYGIQACNTSRVLSHTTIYHPQNLKMGEHSLISTYCQINAKAGVEIGKHVLIGPNNFIWTQNHNYIDRSVPIRLQGYSEAPVVIGDDVWIAARCIILPGVHLGTGTVVAAGAVVTKSTEPFAVVAGVPAKQIGDRKALSAKAAATRAS